MPVGKSAEDNPVVRTHGTPKTFVRLHAAGALGPRSGARHHRLRTRTKISGARFTVLSGAGARLERALISFMLDLHTTEHGYREMEPPFMVNRASMIGTGNLPKFEADLFKIAGDWDLYLIPTAEVPLTNLHRDEIIDGRDLPIRYTAYTPCFRSEAGSHGQDVRGLIRQHQFDKVELVKFATPEQSHAELRIARGECRRSAQAPRAAVPHGAALHGRHGLRVSEDLRHRGVAPQPEHVSRDLVLQQHRVVPGTARKHQFRPNGAGKPEYVHTLNGSGLAVGRTLIAILENYQQADGSIVIPTALRPWHGRTRADLEISDLRLKIEDLRYAI